MFVPVKMSRLEAVVLKKDARAVLRGLGVSGKAEISAAKPGPDTAPARPADNGAALDACAALKGRIALLRKELGLGAEAAPRGEEIGYPAAAALVGEWELKAEVPLGKRRDLAAEDVRLSGESQKLAVYSGLPLPAGGPGPFRFLYFAAGSVPDRSLPSLRSKIPENAVLAELAGKNGRSYLAALAAKSSREKLEAALEDSGFMKEEVSSKGAGTLGELYAHSSAEAGRIGAALEQAGREISSLAAAASGALAAAERAAAAEARLLEAERLLPGTAASVFLSGWAPAEQAGNMKRVVGENSGWRCAVETFPAGQDGEAPVLLRPPRLLRPFAALVTGYGLPRYGEADPTVFAALSFLMMFGMMFGDAGHGALLCLAGAWLSRRRKDEKREAGRAVFACGASSMFFGLVYGSFFGVPALKKYALWRDPLEGDPLALLAAAVLTGAAVISLGVVINIVNRARLGDRLGAALDRFGAAGLVFYWAALLLAAGRAAPGTALPLMAAAAACWALKGPLLCLVRSRCGAAECGDGFWGAAAEALIGAFEGALLYLANTVSFVRLAAYAMSHAALLAAAWMLRDAADKAWGQNSAAGVAALIAGNAAAIGLEGIVAAVQALRLEYYEFFGKFFEGGGRPFRPFTLESKGG